MICIVLFFGILFLMGRYVLKIRPWDGMGTKEDIIRYFEENQELFEEVVNAIQNNNYKEVIYGNWVLRDEDSKYFMYYQDTENESIIEIFSKEEWYLDDITANEESEKQDKCIIFNQSNNGGYDYWGVYYVEDDELIGWSGLKRFKPTENNGDGYLLEKDGCRYYTERICENWWYFQANY